MPYMLKISGYIIIYSAYVTFSYTIDMTFKVTVVNNIYRKAITSSDIRFFIEKLKAIIFKKIFEESEALPLSQNKAEKYAQIRFLTNACVDTMVDYFKGNIDLSLDEVGNVILKFLNNMRK